MRGTLGPAVIRDLSGATRAGKHHGRSGILMTNRPMTPGAHKRAAEVGIRLIDRPVLGRWMAEARSGIEQRGHAPSVPAPALPRRRSTSYRRQVIGELAEDLGPGSVLWRST
jgi:hypothetical protein